MNECMHLVYCLKGDIISKDSLLMIGELEEQKSFLARKLKEFCEASHCTVSKLRFSVKKLAYNTSSKYIYFLWIIIDGLSEMSSLKDCILRMKDYLGTDSSDLQRLCHCKFVLLVLYCNVIPVQCLTAADDCVSDVILNNEYTGRIFPKITHLLFVDADISTIVNHFINQWHRLFVQGQ